jgi:hypothetical protein
VRTHAPCLLYISTAAGAAGRLPISIFFNLKLLKYGRQGRLRVFSILTPLEALYFYYIYAYACLPVPVRAADHHTTVPHLHSQSQLRIHRLARPPRLLGSSLRLSLAALLLSLLSPVSCAFYLMIDESTANESVIVRTKSTLTASLSLSS